MSHPGETPAQRRALDAIGCGNFSPIMAKATRAVLLREGLIELAGQKYVGGAPLRVRIDEFSMPIPGHMAWCAAMAAEHDAETQGSDE